MILPEKASQVAKDRVAEVVEWAKTQTNKQGELITIDMHHDLVDKVREKFNLDGDDYSTFDYNDLIS